MYEKCPVCGLKYEREPGYFIGAMYFSYLISIPPGLLISLAIWRISHLSFNLVMICAFVAYLPLVPAVTRWARVVWMHVDRHFDPDQ
jgi:Ni,Fe-hydrogenase I cytochrome b subunit